MKNEDQLIEHPVEQTNGKMHLDMTFSDARPIEQKQDPKGPSINYVVSVKEYPEYVGHFLLEFLIKR